MDMDEEIETLLAYSAEKLNSLFGEIADKDHAIRRHIKSAKYGKIQDFQEGLEWFNVSEPLFLQKQLQGKIVVLDFFTYCCINCMHILPDLKALEEEFSVEDGLVIIGVHSAKFENEKQSSNILAAVQRYNISHPVVNDSESVMWKNCEIFSWPTLLVLGPHGNPLIMFVGEGNKQNLRLYVKNALDHYKSTNAISGRSLPIKSAHHLLPKNGLLLFPGKIATFVDENNSEILAVSDTGNHRILLAKSDGTILQQIGAGREGFQDGNLSEARFSSPQGLVFRNKNTLYIADTENHAIREVDLSKNSVKTLVGTGKQGLDLIGGKTGESQEISSPWDVCLYNSVLLIAMSGIHQIWAYFFEETLWWKGKKFAAKTCACIAGSGSEENRNNQYPSKAAFAQPSGLVLDQEGQELYIADSESSSVRRLSLLTGKVSAVVGGDRDPCNLFAFGDKDGALTEAKLQHVLGLTIHNKAPKALFVADTYNHKLKRVDTSKNSIETLLIPTDLKPLNEPSGLAFGETTQKLYVCDTNNHSIRAVNFSNDFNKITQIEDLIIRFEDTVTDNAMEHISVYKTNPVEISANGGRVFVKIDVNFAKDTTLTADAPQRWTAKFPANSTSNCAPNSGKQIEIIEAAINIPASKNEESSFCDFNIGFYTCYADTCTPRNFVVRFEIRGKNGADKEQTACAKIRVDSKKIILS